MSFCLLKQSMLIKTIESQVHGWGWITVTEHGMLNATQPKQPSHQALQCLTLPPPPRPLPALRHLDRVSNSELTIPEDSASGRAARRAWWAGYLTSFCKNWQTKGLLKDRASNRNALHGGLGYLEAGLDALLFLHPILPAKSWDHWAAVKGMLKPFSRVRVNTSKKQYGSLAYSSCCPLIKPQGACWKQPSLNNSSGGNQAHSILDIHRGRVYSGSLKLLSHPSPRTHAHSRDQDISLLFTHLFS